MSSATESRDPSELSKPRAQSAAQAVAQLGVTVTESPVPAPEPSPARVPLGARILVIVVCALLGWHFLATATWNSAPNAIRATIGYDTLKTWMIPLFGQSWTVFAPNPSSTNPSLEMRAQVGGTTTEWYSLTARTTADDVQGHLVPSRMYLNDYILASRYYDAALELPVKTRDLAGAELRGEEWWLDLDERLRAEAAPDLGDEIDAFIRYERAALGLISQAAIARWGDGVTAVQLRVVKTPVVPFAERFDDVETQATIFTDGWRSPIIIEGIDTAVFERMFAEEDAR